MINVQSKVISTALVLIIILTLSACTTASKFKEALNEAGRFEYQNNEAIRKLDIPPDLTKPEFDTAFELPKGVISAVSINNGGTGVVEGTSSANTSTSTLTESVVEKSEVAKSEVAKSEVNRLSTGDLSTIKTIRGKTVLQVNDTYSRSLVLTDIMLSRMKFATLSKSSEGDVIVAKYNGDNVSVTDKGKKRGWFNKTKGLIGLGKANLALKKGETYRVTIKNEQESPVVRFQKSNKESISDVAHTKIITLLNDSFNSGSRTASSSSTKSGIAKSNTAQSNVTKSNISAVRPDDLSSIKSIGGRSVLQVNDTYSRSLVLTEIMLTRMKFSTLSKSSEGDVIVAKYNGNDVLVAPKKTGFFNATKGLIGLGEKSNFALKKGKNYRILIKNEENTPIIRFEQADKKSIPVAAHAKIITLLNKSFNR